MKARLLITAVGAALLLAGCGTTLQAEFANRLIGADGQTIVLDDIRAIVDDPSLTADQKRTRLRELGIADETLINALLTL